eukprot:SM000066S20473  [mRNA]  locus=s66:615204:615538:+ [translate_table: standard]
MTLSVWDAGAADSAPDDAATIFTGPGTKDSLGISLTRSLTFPAQGVYRYYCSNHPDEMVGTVNVLAPAGKGPPPRKRAKKKRSPGTQLAFSSLRRTLGSSTGHHACG